MSGAAGLTGVVPETLPVSFAAERTSAKDEAGERRTTSDPAPRGTVPKDGPRGIFALSVMIRRPNPFVCSRESVKKVPDRR